MGLDYTPYSTAQPFMRGLPGWMGPDDGERVEAYTLYEQMYWSVPSTFVLTQLGSDDMPIYIPNPKVIIEAILRYLCVDWDIAIDPKTGDEAKRKLAYEAFTKLFKRENVKAKYKSQLRYCLMRGDAMWHITADANKKEGSRISLEELDPATYFPIYHEDNLNKLIGCHIVDQWEDEQPNGSVVTMIRRQTYRKEVNALGVPTGRITSECSLFEIGAWDDRNMEPNELKLVRHIIPKHTLPEQIDQLPVYHWKNIRNPADPFGSSQLRGLERLFAAVNQTISDEDLAVALAGLGVYATDSNAPVDENGDEVNWLIGPGRVVEITPGTKFSRVPGIQTVEPSQDHIKYLESKIREASGVPDIAVGSVDVQVAESGIALMIKMSPLLTQNAEKELEILGKTDQMLYDLATMWFPAYEGLDFGAVVIESTIADPMPQNRAAEIEEIVKLATANPPLITIAEARERLNLLGFKLLDVSDAAIMAQLKSAADAVAPPVPVVDPAADPAATGVKTDATTNS